MRRWSLLVVLFLAVWAQEEEPLLKRVFLKTPASFVNLTSELWKVTEDTEEVLLAVRFRSQSAEGRILSTTFLRQDGHIEAELILALEEGELKVDLVDSVGQNVLIKSLVNTYMNESAEHSVFVKINTATKTVSYSVEPRKEITAEITTDIQWAGAEILATIGGGPRSIIGCVTLVAIQASGSERQTHAIVLSQNEVDKCETETECAQRNCGKGRCKALEVATCDCFGTSKSGPNCANEPKTVELNNNDDTDPQAAALVFTPWKEDQTVTRLSMEFRFKSSDEGVLIYGSLEGGDVLKMYAVENLGTLVMAGKKLMNFTLGPNNNFHNVLLQFDKDQLHLSVDKVTQHVNIAVVPQFTSITFGSSPPSNGVTELGLTACLRNIYVDHLDILELHSNRDLRVATPKPLKSCSDPNEVALLTGAKVFPADPDVFPVVAMPEDEEDEPEDDDPVYAGYVFGNPISRKKDTMPCEKAQEYLCRNGATCLRGPTRPTCICAYGYGGSACQFSLFPRSCSEASQFHRLPQGPTRLDVDGSGDLSVSVVDCRYDVTKIPHDMPANTAIRSSEAPNHGLFVLSYMDFSPAKLETLIAHSSNCRQQITYKCNHAPLHFSEKRTWFRVASKNSTLSQLGAVPNGCQCIDVGCVNQGRCNCDAGNIASDEGVLQGSQAGVTSIVALHREGDVSGEMTISPLECSGFVSESNAIHFQRPGSYLLDSWRSGTLSLHFRTADATGTLLSVKENDNRVLQLELLDGHTLKAVTEEGELVVESQAKLNDTKWHLLVIEWMDNELRVSVDAASSFRELKSSPFGVVTLGDADRGIVGCFRSILLDQQVAELKGSIDGIVFGRCEDRCASMTCRNGAECRENFATGTAQCSCKYPRLHSGADCSHDINVDTSVSFHGGFLKFEDLASPLTSSWLLSFRTDQSSALLLYIHDENNNFLQLHVRDETNVTLSLNNGGNAYSCTVQAPPGVEYSDMRWIQVYIDHTSAGTTLTVEDEACSIRASRLLADTVQTVFSPGIPDVVMPPIGIGGVNTKFVYTFLGGVQRARKETESIRLTANYASTVEDLLGCMRGVKVGNELLDLRAKTKELEDRDLVQVGCDVKCESLSCYNGGHCSVAWRDFNPTSVKTSCDCSRTSYAGPNCLLDDGINLTSLQSVNFDIGEILGRYFEPTSPPAQSLKFAFSADPIGSRQMLAILYFADSSEFEILLNKNGSLHVGIVYANGRSTAMTFKGNFTDGYRHFFVARFISTAPPRVYVDGARKDFAPIETENLSLYRSRRLWLGGQSAPADFESGIPPKKNLQGCVSNVNLDFGVNVLNLWPLSYLDPSSDYSNLTLLQPSGTPSRGSCAAFKDPNKPVSVPNTVSLPAWETNFQRHEYKLQDGDNNDQDGGGIPWLLIILGIILLLVLIGLIFVVICLCRKSHTDNQPQNISLDEREPLRQTQFAQTPPLGPRQPHSNYSVPPPDIQLPSPRPRRVTREMNRNLKTVVFPNGTAGSIRVREDATSLRSEGSLGTHSGVRQSLISQPDSQTTTAYFTAQEDLSDGEDFERTLTPGSEAPTVFEDEISRPTGFDRSSPQRLSSFRDSSVPVRSPLYAAENGHRRPRPIAVPKPPPRGTSPV